MWIGIFLICVGIIAILDNMHIIEGDIWQYIWPLFLILLGGSLLLKRRRSHENDSNKPDKTFPV